MQLFGAPEAAHFCSSYTPIGGTLTLTPDDLGLTKNQQVSEGTPAFDRVRAAVLEEAERNLFFGASHYRRALELMVPASAHWAHVTLYYGTWYVAHAMLGMFGGAVLRGRAVLEVGRSNPGNQMLRTRPSTTAHRGPHQAFWDDFYRGANAIRPRLDARLAVSLAPISGDPLWLIEARKAVNYNTVEALKAAVSFSGAFSSATFPASLPGALATQYHVLEGMLEAAFAFAKDFGLRTPALASLDARSDLTDCVRKHIYGAKAPGLVRRTKKHSLL